MLLGECCEKAVHPWVPRRRSALGTIVASAEHANEVIMLASPLVLLPFTVWALPGDAASYRCHIWHNKKSISKWVTQRKTD